MTFAVACLFCERAAFEKPENRETYAGLEVEKQPSISPEPRLKNRTF